MKVTSANLYSGASSSSRSDSGESESTMKFRSSSHRNFSGRRFFMSKPIHPLSFPTKPSIGEASNSHTTNFMGFETGNLQKDANSWSSASSSVDLTEVPEQLEPEASGEPCISLDSYKCVLCERPMSKRSPWSSRRIVSSGDMPVAGVLSCHHVFHAECLDQVTPKTLRNDPPCPLCAKSEDENLIEQQGVSKLRNSHSKLRPSSEDGPSKPWGCVQAGDCVDGALHAPSRNAMMLLNRNCIKKSISLKGTSGKGFPGKVKKGSGSYSSQLFGGSSLDKETVEYK